MSTKNEKQTIVISATSSIGRALFKKYAAISNRILLMKLTTKLIAHFLSCLHVYFFSLFSPPKKV